MLQTPHSAPDNPMQQSPSPLAPTTQRKPRKPRGRGLRTTTGCTVCRRRHMKCDETKPVCGQCTKGGRQCVYHSASKQPDSSTTSEADGGAHPASPTEQWQQPASSPRDNEDHRRLPKEITSPQALWSPVQSQTTINQEVVRQTTDEGHWNRPAETFHSTSPQSNFSGSTGYPSEIAPLRWFGLLADDAANGDDNIASLAFLNESNYSGRSPNLGEGLALEEVGTSSYQAYAPGLGAASLQFIHPITPTSVPRSIPETGDGREFWQSPTKLHDHEVPIFRRFVNHFSRWIDMFDPLKHFSTFVPHLALHNEGLMKAILALSARHLSIKPMEPEGSLLDRTTAVQYYYETLQYLQRAMKHESYTRSLELIATALTVSTYEMIDGAGKGWERHLKGVFWIQRSQDITGESGGLKQAVWWAWLRQDLWAAFRERRRAFSFFKPTKPYHLMDQYDIASRVVYLLVQAVNYSSLEESKIGENNLGARIDRADTLFSMLEEWRQNLSVHFNPLPLESKTESIFKPVWINPPAFGTSISSTLALNLDMLGHPDDLFRPEDWSLTDLSSGTAIQMYFFARILLLVHRPAAGGYLEYAERSKQLIDAVDAISGIATTLTDDAASVISTQCLFGAGLYTQDVAKRDAILSLIEAHQERTGWPVSSLREELVAEWAKSNPG